MIALSSFSLSSPDASELSWTYPLQGTAYNWIRQRKEPDNQPRTVECVCGERVEQQLEFELNRTLFPFDERQLSSKSLKQVILI